MSMCVCVRGACVCVRVCVRMRVWDGIKDLTWRTSVCVCEYVQMCIAPGAEFVCWFEAQVCVLCVYVYMCVCAMCICVYAIRICVCVSRQYLVNCCSGQHHTHPFNKIPSSASTGEGGGLNACLELIPVPPCCCCCCCCCCCGCCCCCC